MSNHNRPCTRRRKISSNDSMVSSQNSTRSVSVAYENHVKNHHRNSNQHIYDEDNVESDVEFDYDEDDEDDDDENEYDHDNRTDRDDLDISDKDNFEQKSSPAINKMMTVYDRKSTIKITTTTKSEILKLVRRLVIPHEKFVHEGDELGSFSRPNFEETSTWYYLVLSKGGFKDCNTRVFAKAWVGLRSDIAEVFSNHRSYSTVNMKKAFLKGECN